MGNALGQMASVLLGWQKDIDGGSFGRSFVSGAIAPACGGAAQRYEGWEAMTDVVDMNVNLLEGVYSMSTKP